MRKLFSILALFILFIPACSTPPGANNIVMEPGTTVSIATTSPVQPTSGAPVRYGYLTGLALTTYRSTDNLTTVDFGNFVCSIPVTAAGGNIAAGDALYYRDSITGVTNYSTGTYYFGVAMGAVTSGSTTTINVVHTPSPGAGTLGSGTIGATNLASNSVITVKINDGAVTAAKLGSDTYDPGIIVVSTTGSDTLGNGSYALPFLTVTKAFTLVTPTRATVILEPGYYSEAAPLVWPTISNVQLLGTGIQGTYLTAPGTTQVITITPGAQTASWQAVIENIYIVHSTAGEDGILLNNTGAGKKLSLYLKNIGDYAASDSDNVLITTHTDTANAIRVFWEGGTGGYVVGKVYFDVKNASDMLYIEGVELRGGITTTADAVAVQMRFKDCILKESGGAGGDAAQLCAMLNCFDMTGTTYTAADSGDVPTCTLQAVQ